MAAAADNILANLPRLFAPLPRPTAISALADAFGGELTGAENSLAAVMFAHWVDYADTDAITLTDLTSIAALYGLAPRDNESIEGFRAHLKRHVRTFLEGTVTTKGILRVVAESLAMVIADDDTQLDTWWNRKPASTLTTVQAAGDDAATLLLGIPSASVRGTDASSAEFAGTVDLSQAVDLTDHSLIQVAVDGGAPVTVDLATHFNPASASLQAIVTALSTVPGLTAEARNGRLAIRSKTAGASSSLQLGDIAGDAFQALLGVSPHLYNGTPAARALMTGTIDLPATQDLTTQRYLRIAVDGVAYEVDCAANGTPAAITPAQIVQAITTQVAAGVASLKASRLALSSPTLGLAGTVALLVPTTGDATRLLLGDISTYARGADNAQARVTGTVDLSGGIDLSQRSVLKIAIDALPPVVVLCAGADPKKTFAGEIATAINAAVGRQVASQNGRAVTLTSQQSGPAGAVRFLDAPANDALDLIFGLGTRNAAGSDSSSARITGTATLNSKVNLSALQRLSITVDDGAPTIVNMAAAGLGRAGVTAAEISAAINTTLGAAIASTDGTYLTLSSGLSGTQSALAIQPIETSRSEPFVSRAFSTDEAANTVLGIFTASADGSDATPASLVGGADLHDGLDLRVAHFLRIAVDGGAPVDVDCAHAIPRPRVALLSEIVNAINTQLKPPGFASISEGRLVLTSPTSGATSAVSTLANAGDGTRTIFGRDAGTVNGADAQRLIFTGLTDLSKGIDLSAASHVRLAIDAAAPVEVDCAGSNPAQTSPAEIASRINGALGGSYASTDGTNLRVSSAQTGSAASIAFLAPAANDATHQVFGIDAGRTYVGRDATPAILMSSRDLPSPIDLSATPYIRIGIDNASPILVDCRGVAADKTSLDEIAGRINAALPEPQTAAATVSGARVVVTAKSAGSASRITLTVAGDGDASALLLGTTTSINGSAGSSATLIGTVDLRSPVDLSTRPVLRLAVDGSRPLDIDVSGAAPDRTLGDEIAHAINAELPSSASLDGSGHLVLRSPTAGASSHIEVQPLRALELIEYQTTPITFGPLSLKTGQRFTLNNDGATDASVTFSLSSEHGIGGFDLVNLTAGYRIHVETITPPNKTVNIAVSNGSVAATLVDSAGVTTPVAPYHIVATPQMLTATVPFKGPRRLATRKPGERPALALVDVLANNVVILESRSTTHSGPSVTVSEADATAASSVPSAPAGPLLLLGRLQAVGRTGTLVDSTGAMIANVRLSGTTSFDNFNGRMVCASGTWYPGAALLNVETLARLFDIEIGGAKYSAVTLDPRTGARCLTTQIAASEKGLILARDFTPSRAFNLRRGRSDWMLAQCNDARFDSAVFNHAEFSGGVCNEPGIFDFSRFNATGDDSSSGRPKALARGLTRFAPLADAPPISLSATWQSHQPGAFVVNLPADLPPQFGARFNDAHFGSKNPDSETFKGLVLDPPNDAQHVATVLSKDGNASALVYAQAVPAVPIGWEGESVPFGQPRRRQLTGGNAQRAAALYLQEQGVPGAVAIFARSTGPQGNDISISVRYANPGVFDIDVNFAPARFECARAIAYAGRVIPSDEDPIPTGAPVPIGVIQAKAAGIHAAVTRERT